MDEGPGLSGSSITCVAEKLCALGVPERQIVFLPSWQGDPRKFVLEKARERWVRHRKFTASFEHVWPCGGMVDLSGGKWRALLYRDESGYPAVQPQHERRKYLDRAGLLYKFAGPGRFGRSKLERAGYLAEAGFASKMIGLSRGFLITEFVKTTALDRPTMNPIAAQLAWLQQRFKIDRPVPWDALIEMMWANVAEGLGRGGFGISPAWNLPGR